LTNNQKGCTIDIVEISGLRQLLYVDSSTYKTLGIVDLAKEGFDIYIANELGELYVANVSLYSDTKTILRNLLQLGISIKGAC